MNSSFTIGRVRGIEIGVNWSWVVVFALLVWILYASVFPAQYDLSDGTYLAMALVAAVLFFVSLLLHELGHAFQAQREGMEIEGITLWLFGGVAKFRGMFPSAGAEFRIAIAGPVVSLVLGLAFLGLALTVEMPDPVAGVAGYLGTINLILLAFNMLPALPLDGGRVLRSALWAARGDFAWATRLAAGIGRAFGYLFIAVGLLLVFAGHGFQGVWTAFIGWFLLGAASGEARYLAVRDALGGLRVRDLMVRAPRTVEPGLTIGALMDDVVWEHRHTSYPVVRDGRAVGLLPFRCVAQVPRREWDERTVADCMLPLEGVPTLREDDELTDALLALGDGGVGRALVLDDGRLAGFLSITDLVRALETGGLRRRRRRALAS